MGMSLFSRSSEGCARPDSRPNPRNWIQMEHMYIGKYLILRVQYPDCTNFEGQKILVFRNVVLGDLIKQGSIDPHFSDSKTYISPIARFIPTYEGWIMAQRFCNQE